MSNGTRLVQARINNELADWFDAHFGHGAKQAFITNCFEALRDAVESGQLPEMKDFSRVALFKLLVGDKDEAA